MQTPMNFPVGSISEGLTAMSEFSVAKISRESAGSLWLPVFRPFACYRNLRIDWLLVPDFADSAVDARTGALTGIAILGVGGG